VAARIALARSRTEIRSDRSTRDKSMRIFERENVGQRGHRSHARNLAQTFRFGVAGVGHCGDLSIVSTHLAAKVSITARTGAKSDERFAGRLGVTCFTKLCVEHGGNRTPAIFTVPRT